MKITLLNDSFPPVIDGVANVVMNYAKIMTEMPDHEVLVGTPRYPDTDYTQYPYRVISYQSLNTTKATAGYRTGNPFDMRAVHEMAQFGGDLIHAHSPASALYVARVLRSMTKAPIVYTYHTKYDIDIARAVSAEFARKEAIKFMVENISACDEVWAVSRGAGENLRSLGYEGEYKVVTNGVDFPKGRADRKDVEEAVKGYDLPEGVPFYLFVGRIMNYKGLPLILDALRILHAAGHPFRMGFIGSGADADGLKKTAEEYGIAQNVFFTGPIRDRNVLRAWNTRADLFLFPSTFDTNGLVVREAAACGLASVLIRDSCASEGITDGRNGFLVEENAESLADLLLRLGNDLNAMHSVGEHAMEEIYVSWNDCVKYADELYRDLYTRYINDRLPVKKPEAMDRFIDQVARQAEIQGEYYTRQARFRAGMMENIGAIREDMKENISTIRSTVQENAGMIRRDAENFRAGVEEDLNDFKKEVKEGRDNIRDSIRELGEKTKEAIADRKKK